VLLDLDGVLLNSIAIRRYILSALSNRIKVPNRTERQDLGPVLAISSGVSQGEIGRFPEITGECERIAMALGARGPLNVQCRFVEGRVHVFEINPRFSGTTSLRAMVGYNEPDVLVRRHLLGQDIPRHFEYGSGVIMRSLSETLVQSGVIERA
jgi:carbamoyl-phosphate synthase large subunit